MTKIYLLVLFAFRIFLLSVGSIFSSKYKSSITAGSCSHNIKSMERCSGFFGANVALARTRLMKTDGTEETILLDVLYVAHLDPENVFDKNI